MKLSHSPITLGQRTGQFDVGPFVLTEATYPPSRVLPRHAHDFATISFVLKGACIETIGKRAYECMPFCTILKPAGEYHTNQYGPAGARCLLIGVTKSGLELIRSSSSILENVVHHPSGAFSALGIRIYQEFQNRDGASALSIEGLILEMMGAATRSCARDSVSPRPRKLREAREFIEEHFREQISLSRVASSLNVNPAYLSRVFRKHYGSTIGDYVRRLRLEYASRRMAHSLDPVADIALDAGFYDQSHFTHAFKLHLGLTPTEFRSTFQKR